MCLGTVVRVTRVTAGRYLAECDAGGVELLVCTQLVGPVRPGDWLLVHAGYGLAIVDQAAAGASRRLLKELLAEDGIPVCNGAA